MFRRFFSSSRNGRIGSKGGKGKGGTNRSATNGDAKETSADSKAAPSHTSVVQGFSELFQKDTRQSLRMHERLDWKVFNFVLALLPAAALYVTMTYVRKDMDRLVSEGGLQMGVRRSKREPEAGRSAEDQDPAKITERLKMVNDEMREVRKQLEQQGKTNLLLQEQVDQLRQNREEEKEKEKEKNGKTTSSWRWIFGRGAMRSTRRPTTEEAKEEKGEEGGSSGSETSTEREQKKKT